ncbi:Bacillopeptidase F [Bacillus paralicheniformis]|nr:Bacillopeptidase F [Bacillus paralicheniformis]
MKRKLRKKAFSTILSGLLIGSLFMPAVSDAAAKPALTSMKEQAAAGKEKISKSLVKQFKKEDQITFLIKLKDQVDTPKVAKQAEKNAKKKSLSAAKTEYQKRSAVVSALRVKADETQSDLKRYLKNQEKQGKVKKSDPIILLTAWPFMRRKRSWNK